MTPQGPGMSPEHGSCAGCPPPGTSREADVPADGHVMGLHLVPAGLQG